MNKSIVTTVLLWLSVFLLGMLKTYASPISNTADATSLTEEDDLNFVSFEVNVNEPGNYLAEFWVMPAKYIDGGYTQFSVYANDQYIGNISPTRDNWQAARIEGNERLPLKRGLNIIKVGVPSPEMPAVECVKVGSTDMETSIYSAAYDRFYREASTGMTYDIPKGEQFVAYSNNDVQSNNAPEVSLKHFSDVPLKYTFHVQFNFIEGKEVFISTTGDSEHDVDIFYAGQKKIVQSNDSESEVNNLSISINEISDPMNSGTVNEKSYVSSIGANRKLKQMQVYDPASSEESQGLNWKSISTSSPGLMSTTVHETSKIIKIPKTGVYIIRLRHREPGKTGKVSLFVNNTYAYPDMPISFTWLPCELPANGNEYGTMARSSNPDMDDPMLFIHGAAADRVVGLGDDASLLMQSVHELSPYDSHVLQQYYVRTSGISVCNYFSNTPESTCYVIAGIDESYFEPDPEFWLKPKSIQTNDKFSVINTSGKVKISDYINFSGVVSITSEFTIHKVTVSDISGIIIGSFQCFGKEFAFSKDQLNIQNSGIYIVNVETDNGTVSKKLILD